MLYHGTSSILPITDKLLPPVMTNINREDFHSRNKNYVYLTDSLKSAVKYAKKSVEKFGGTPVILISNVKNAFNIGNHEFLCEDAKIIGRITL